MGQDVSTPRPEVGQESIARGLPWVIPPPELALEGPPNVFGCQILGEVSLARWLIYRDSAAINAVTAALHAPS